MMHKAWRSIEEVPYCFSRSSIKLHGHTGGKIDDFNPNWDYLAGRSYQIPQICLVTVHVSIWISISLRSIQPLTQIWWLLQQRWKECGRVWRIWLLSQGPPGTHHHHHHHHYHHHTHRHTDIHNVSIKTIKYVFLVIMRINTKAR